MDSSQTADFEMKNDGISEPARVEKSASEQNTATEFKIADLAEDKNSNDYVNERSLVNSSVRSYLAFTYTGSGGPDYIYTWVHSFGYEQFF